jgi:hypothetical protein
MRKIFQARRCPQSGEKAELARSAETSEPANPRSPKRFLSGANENQTCSIDKSFLRRKSRPSSQHKSDSMHLAGSLQSQCCGVYRHCDNDATEHKSRKAIKTAKIRDPRLVGRMSPYPTVVAVMNDQ